MNRLKSSMEIDVIVVRKTYVALNFVEKYERLKNKKRISMLLQLTLLNMPEPARMCLYKQDSEYALGPKCVKILNMAKF